MGWSFLMSEDKSNIDVPNILGQEKSMEVLMPIELIEQIFDSSRRIGFETSQERIQREHKEDYNSEIIKRVMDVNFTDKQRVILNSLFFQGKTMAQTAIDLGVTLSTIQKVKHDILKKIRKKVKYEFKYLED